jgi:hypothetical protein
MDKGHFFFFFSFPWVGGQMAVGSGGKLKAINPLGVDDYQTGANL